MTYDRHIATELSNIYRRDGASLTKIIFWWLQYNILRCVRNIYLPSNWWLFDHQKNITMLSVLSAKIVGPFLWGLYNVAWKNHKYKS